MSLTKRQREILDYLTIYTEDKGYAPSFEEIAAHFNYSSLATVHEHLSNLERKSYIKRRYNESRGIQLLSDDELPRSVQLPMLGMVAAGLPIEVMEQQEMIAVPDNMVSRSGNHYVLTVRGNSMVDEHILDGDMVVVNDRKNVTNGETVIALIEGSSATVKKLYREKDGRIRLQPANSTMDPIYIHENDFAIQGVVVGVMRRC